MEKYYLPRYHIVALTVNIKHGIGSGNDEMIMGNWKIDVRSAEYKYIESIQKLAKLQILNEYHNFFRISKVQICWIKGFR